MGLTDDDLRAVLTRAEAIQGSGGLLGVTEAEVEAFIQAAEEVGFTRTAVEQALREHLNIPMKLPAAGDLAFAKSADDKYYVAEITTFSSRDNIRVRFLRGSEHSVALDDLRPCSFVPGEKVVCPWPWWGPWTCTVQSYDAAAREITVGDGWGETRKFAISDVWLNPSHKSGSASRTRTRLSLALIGAGVAVGTVVGSIITALLMR